MYEGENVVMDARHPKLKFEQLGDALRYGLLYELPAENTGGSDFAYRMFYAAVLYMYFHDMICRKTLDICERGVMKCGGKMGNREGIKMISDALMKELTESYAFHDFDDVVEILNRYKIPNWLQMTSHKVINLYSRELIDDELYYLIEYSEDASRLVVVDTYDITESFNFEKNANVRTLGSGYDEMVGVGRADGKLYLTVDGVRDIYVSYDCKNKIKTIEHAELYDVISGNCIVKTKDGMLAYKMGNCIIPIKKYNRYEWWDIFHDQWVVKPTIDSPDFFKPYLLASTGKEKALDLGSRIVKEHLWRYISDVGNYDDIPHMPKYFTVAAVKDGLHKSFSVEYRISKKSYIVFERILDFIAKYVDEKEEITDILYILCDLNKKVAESGVLSEHVLWVLEALELQDVNLSELLSKKAKEDGYTEFSKALLDEIKWAPKRSSDRIGYYYGAYIGTFVISDGKVEVNRMTLGEGLYIGNQVVPICNDKEWDGLVIYNIDEGKRMIYTLIDLTDKQSEEIEKRFDIQYSKYERVIDHRRADE